MADAEYRCIAFVENGNLASGYFFYNAATCSDYGHIIGITNLTLEKALKCMAEKGIDPVKNFKMSIAVYP